MTRYISKQHLLNEVKRDFFLSLSNRTESDFRDFFERLFAPINKVDHICILENNDLEYGQIMGGKAYKTFDSIYGVPVWEFLDTLPLGNWVNLTTHYEKDVGIDGTLYRSLINYFIDHDYILEKSKSRGFAREAHFSFKKR